MSSRSSALLSHGDSHDGGCTPFNPTPTRPCTTTTLLSCGLAPVSAIGAVDALMVLTSAYLNAAQRVLTTKTIAQAGELVHELPSVAAGFHVAALCEP